MQAEASQLGFIPISAEKSRMRVSASAISRIESGFFGRAISGGFFVHWA